MARDTGKALKESGCIQHINSQSLQGTGTARSEFEWRGCSTLLSNHFVPRFFGDITPKGATLMKGIFSHPRELAWQRRTVHFFTETEG